jgi:predicted Rdx family selenoprotein
MNFMESQLTSSELYEKQQLLQDYNPAQEAIALLSQNKGRFDISFDQLWEHKNGVPTFGEGKSLWQSTLKVLRQELCGDDGFRAQFQEYTKNPGSAPLLTGLIVSLTTLSGLPIDPAIATVVVLYLLKVGLKIFCEYTEPADNKQKGA